ncbi:MAG: hypothetical protein SYNGOMJ08_00864 [Candidatus Syntrophoarchaeum sp. GoM_oil]|nr:MAG: hypothetical protein SYNGOMJ08_00864 [Candidatus Syntrophoarchaeum sp. GoM_oil]
MYFKLHELGIIIGCAGVSFLLNTQLPIQRILTSLGIPGPAAGIAVFGGFLFVIWIFLAYRLVEKNFAGIATAIFIPAFCLMIGPWYGVTEPPWFGIYGIGAFLLMGLLIELLFKIGGWTGVILGGGLGNLTCILVTWAAIGYHTGILPTISALPILAAFAIFSGALGSVVAELIYKYGKPVS